MRYVLDTNIISEGTKPVPHQGCVDWLREHASECCITTITIAEIRYGIERLTEGRKKRELERKVDLIRANFGNWILDFDEMAATEFGRYAAEFEADRGSHALCAADIRDLQNAAIARAHGWTVATRNTGDYPFVRCVNPFEFRQAM